MPGLGEPLDLANAAIYAAEGNEKMAALSAAGAVPIAGWGATGTKAGIRAGDEAGGAAKGSDDPSDVVYRVHGGAAAPGGHSWTPTDPTTLKDPRGELGLPDVNSGEFLTKARVKDWTGVSGRRALPLDGNPGGAPEYLFPSPLKQLEHLETRPLRPPH